MASETVFLLKSRKKWNNYGTSRIQPVEETLKKVNPLVKQIGITRVADITDMDRLRIPNYSAVLPGTEDYIWVYSGKGPTKNHAKASVIMESIERFSSLPANYEGKILTGKYKELSKSYDVLKYDEVIEPLSFQLTDEMNMDYCIGYDLISQKDILIPSSLAIFRYNPNPPSINPYSFFHTNGLASGNVMEEAICHALCEVIERDAVSIAEFSSSAFQYHLLKTIENGFLNNGILIRSLESKNFIDDNTVYSDIDLNGLDYPPVKKIVREFHKCQISLKVKDITTEIGIPTFIASSVEWVNHDYGYLVEGHGTHPDSRIALMRAITEVSQSRAANIQGSRDDLRKMKYDPQNSDENKSWQFMASPKKKAFTEVNSFYNDDILDDIKLILGNLKNKGFKNAIVVNLTNSRLQVPVVRIIVPGLETFKINKLAVGSRAQENAIRCLTQDQ
ncbi:methanogenesis marker 1 protein [Candidatus Nitrosocosmicus sp.]|uniref:YcaO-like family protein n=1 Tax=Candidatus Nitrosocosmicus sp. FF01 TaxID=3397670 RepID=UPI002ACC77D7|nr:methanogenesis marker 1 protein [Candidatus Nitrosocosmicus sp.]